MKKFVSIFALALVCVALGAQSRDLSRYANDSFSDNDRYRTDSVYQTVSVKQPKGKKVKNVIVMIGDGMGFEQVSCGLVLNGGSLNMTSCPYTGVSKTYTTDKLITDSCAGGSALGTGVKTRYGYMGMDPDGKPVTTALEYAHSKGKKTGVMVTCRLNDATPIDFCGHSTNRGDEENIMAQYVDMDLDYIVGGGTDRMQKREDGRDLIAEMQDKGYNVVMDQKALEAAQELPVLGVFGDLEVPAALDRGDYLPTAVRKALELLSGSKKGFVMMVEGSRIDDFCHRHMTGHFAEELLDFDRAVGEVLKWAEQDGETLVVITADHATGGVTLLGGSRDDRSIKVNYSTKGHNGIFVPVFTFGPHAEDFVGVHENSEIGAMIMKLIK